LPVFAEPVQPAIFPVKPGPALLKRLSAIPRLGEIRPASRLEVRPRPEMVSAGIADVDALSGGLPRGCLSEICGPASSGATSVMRAALAAATQRQEVCALVDTANAFDPFSGAAANIDLQKLLWVRCGEKLSSHQNRDTQSRKSNSAFREDERKVEQALRALDLLLQSGGFGMVAIDFSDVPFQLVRRIPLASWFRFQRVIENTRTLLLVVAPAPCAQTCASVVIKLQSGVRSQVSGQQCSTIAQSAPAHTQLLDGLQIEAELLRSRLGRKPVQSVSFVTRVARAG
jgi:hypothetical protein